MDEHVSRPQRKTILLIVIACIPMAFFSYLASYAPYLHFVKTLDAMPSAFDPYYRSPSCYRIADWFLTKPPMSRVPMWWAKRWGVEDETIFQAFYYSQGISDPSSEVHFNIQH